MNIEDIVREIGISMGRGEVKLVEVTPKDFTIMKAVELLRQMEKKIEPLLLVRECLVDTLKDIVFEKGTQDAEYTIVVDEHHSVIFSMKAGEFDMEATCDCPDHKEQWPDKAAG